MPTYTVTGYQWSGFTNYPTPLTVTIDDDDPDLDWFGGDTGTPQTATFGGTTYNINGAGLIPTEMQDNDGGGGVSTEELLFMSLQGYGWVFVPMPGSVFTPGDDLLSFPTNAWSDTDGVPHADVACFTAGTQIATDLGLVDVESLGAGDLVLTHDNGAQPVRRRAKTFVGTGWLLSDPDIRPMLIRRGALGPNTPSRDTRVSPQHRILYRGWKAEFHFGSEEVFVSAKALGLIGLAERDDSLTPVTYVHILLDSHEILTGDGMKSESLMPADIARTVMSDAQLSEVEKLVPQYFTAGDATSKLARQQVRVQEARVLG